MISKGTIIRLSPLSEEAPFIYETEVYSFNTDTWRDSDAVIPDGICFDDCENRPTICAKGVYSTMAYTQGKETGERSYFLITIDMGNEVFILTPMPQAKNFEACRWQNKVLIELNKSVAFMKYEEESCAVFVLNDYGPRGVWTKLYTIPSFFTRPIGSWNNEVLFDAGVDGVVLLDPVTHEWGEFGRDGVNKQVLEYTESLAWVNAEGDPWIRKEEEEEVKQVTNFVGVVIDVPSSKMDAFMEFFDIFG